MRSLIISDLHLGSSSRSDLLRRPELRASLLEQLADVDRLILLGDVLELRHGPLREAMLAARPFFEDLGRALEGRELVITAGNHDHALVEGWLAGRVERCDPGPIGVEQLLEPQEASTALGELARWAAPARVSAAYPGLWVRPDVYATHGHYLDCHITVPTLERLSMGAMCKLLGRSPSTFAAAEDYETIGGPVFAWRDVVARHVEPGAALNGRATVTAWRALGGGADVHGGMRRAPLARRLRRRALVGAFPLAVGALNRAGLGPLHADISPAALRSAGLAAMGEVAARLGLGDAHVVFGHTHRRGPLEADAAQEWLGRAGAKLHNTGSWTYASIFLDDRGASNPYWPGTGVIVEDDGPPRQVSMLADRERSELLPPAASARSPVRA
jgi:hypothetical protein